MSIGRHRSTRFVALFLTLAIVLGLDVAVVGQAGAASPSGLTYVYDALGRLSAVVDPNAGTAIYHYDADGNVTSITRQSSSITAVLGFQPVSATTGTSVTVQGTGFSKTASQDQVDFNGVAATVTKASATSLVVTVPSGATSGAVEVTAPSGSATSAASFTVHGALGPSVTSFGPGIGVSGGALTVIGSGFDTTATNDGVRFGSLLAPVTAASTGSLSVQIPPGVPSGPISVQTPFGIATAPGTFFAAPSPWTAAQIGFTSQIVPGGAPVTVSLPTAGTAGLLVFSGTVRERVSFLTSANSIPDATFTVYNPDGSQLVSQGDINNTGGTSFFDTESLPTTGTYTVLVAPTSGSGSVTVQAYEVPPDVSASVTPGGAPVTVNTTVPGQNASVTFTGKVGQRVSLQLSSGTYSALDLTVLNPDRTNIVAPEGIAETQFIDTFKLTENGTYTIFLDPQQAATGGITITAYNVPADATGTITPGGSAATIATTVPGQNASLTFSGTTGERVSLQIGADSYSGLVLSVLNPDATTLVSGIGLGAGQFVDTFTLPQTGTYTIALNPNGAATGGITITAYNVPADATGTITPGGSAATIATTVPGQNASLTFSGTTGERVSLQIGADSYSGLVLSVLNPDATTLVSGIGLGAGQFVDTFTLPQTGTYTIALNPNGATTGSITITAYNVPADATGTITIGGPTVNIATTVPGQNAAVTFSAATAGQQVTLTMSAVTYAGVTVSIKNNSGTTIAGPIGLGTSGGALGATLATTGTYTIVINPTSADVGQMTLALAATGGSSLLGRSGRPGHGAPPTIARRPGTGPAGARHHRAAAPGQSSAGSTPSTMGPFVTALQTNYRSPYAETWTPAASPAGKPWTTGRAASPWSALPALGAAPGTTAVAGQALTLNGLPLAGVTLSIGRHRTQTDATGRFLLSGVRAGHHELDIDGTTAGPNKNTYGEYEAGVDLRAGVTTVLGFTIWMARIDWSHAVHITYPIRHAIVLTNPTAPGLSVRIPAGSTIKDDDGDLVHRLSLTPLPTDRTPVPLAPGMPDFYTLQPGDVYVGPKGMQVTYPNLTHQPRRTAVDFISYDADRPGLGWQSYGEGHVSADGKRIVADPGTRAWSTVPNGVVFNQPPPPGLKPFKNTKDGDPVDLSTGNMLLRKTDFDLQDTIPIVFARTYRTTDAQYRRFGLAMSDSYDMFVVPGNPSGWDLCFGDGSTEHYAFDAKTGEYVSTDAPGPFYGSTLERLGLPIFQITLRDGTVYRFNAHTAALISITDRNGNTLDIARDFASGDILHITSPNGRWLEFTYNNLNLVSEISDNLGRTVQYGYDSDERLTTVTDQNGGVTHYNWATCQSPLALCTFLASVTDARGNQLFSNIYGDTSAGQVLSQTLAGGGTYTLSYVPGSPGLNASASETNPRGAVNTMTFNTDGYPTQIVADSGTPQARTLTFTLQKDTNLVTAVTDQLGRKVTYAYDAVGDLTKAVQLPGSSLATTTKLTYTKGFNQLATYVDPAGDKTTYTYDTVGDVTKVKDPDGRTTTFAYNPDGTVSSYTDPAGDVYAAAYIDGELTSVTDPLGRVTGLGPDAAGRLVSVTAPNGAPTTYTYDPLDDLTAGTDALGDTTTLAYDADQDLTGITDPRGHATTYGYDSSQRLTSITDPDGHVQHTAYDSAGDVTSYTDAKGQVTTFGHDLLGELTFLGYGTTAGPSYASTDTYSYDGAGRLTGVVDSATGTSSYGYDNLDRLTSATTPQGSITYGYDKASRRTSMTVAGQPVVTYGYDKAGQLLSETQGASVVGLSYDKAGRVTSTELPNGVSEATTFDKASEPTAITDKDGTSTLGTLTYAYDPLGDPTTVGGSFARVTLPAAVSSATYDPANELTNWGGTTLTYDANGALTNDGTASYAYSPRDELASVTAAGSTTSYGYDGFGRRISQTTGATTTSELYDLANPVQELVNGTVSANHMVGLVPDQTFTYSDASGTSDLLTDALGSTVALTNAAGAVTTAYTYSPFGQASASGPASANPFQYTGAQTDPTGLVYLNNRYLDPSIDRFTSQDPAGIGGGTTDLYKYVGDNPMTTTDPFGLGAKDKDQPWYLQLWDFLTGAKDLKDTWDDAKDRVENDKALRDPMDEYRDMVKDRGSLENQQSIVNFQNPVSTWQTAAGSLAGH